MVLAVLTVASALAGLVLVFLGLVISTYQSYETREQSDVEGTYRLLGGLILASFLPGVLSVGTATCWLAVPSHYGWLYVATLVLFAAQLVLLFVATGAVAQQLLWS